MIEIWKDIAEHKGLYQISNKGQIKSLSHARKNGGIHKEHLMNCGCNMYGYKVVRLCKDGVQKLHKIHRLVALAFIPNPNNKPQVNHIDGNKENNDVANLEWVTALENHLHAWKIGLRKKIPYTSQIKQARKQSKLTPEQEKEIRTKYKPFDRENGRTALAKKYGVSHSVIWDILNKKRWYECDAPA